jgi:2,3-bisphosphoglycerate-independent phosphoglycerate mutase
MDGALVISADHGNADEMYMHGKDGRVVRNRESGEPVVKTSHTLNPVPFVVHDPKQSDLYTVNTSEQAGIASVTATCLELLGFRPPDDLAPSLLRFK